MASEFSQRNSAAEYKMMQKGNGHQWLKLFKAGNESIFTEIYHANKVAIYSFALKLLKHNISEAEDITALAFGKLWLKRSDIDEPSHIRPWLFTVARNAIIDLYGKKRKIKSTDLSKTSEIITDESVYDFERAHAEMIEQVMMEIEELPDEVRDVFKLIFFEKKSGQQVALELGISGPKVTRSKQKAYQLLRTALLKKGLSPSFLF